MHRRKELRLNKFFGFSLHSEHLLVSNYKIDDYWSPLLTFKFVTMHFNGGGWWWRGFTQIFGRAPPFPPSQNIFVFCLHLCQSWMQFPGACITHTQFWKLISQWSHCWLSPFQIYFFRDNIISAGFEMKHVCLTVTDLELEGSRLSYDLLQWCCGQIWRLRLLFSHAEMLQAGKQDGCTEKKHLTRQVDKNQKGNLLIVAEKRVNW